MSQAIEVQVPNIGDFKEVPVIEVLVKSGDTARAEDPLITLESEKATMDIPAPTAGVVNELKGKKGEGKAPEDMLVFLFEAAGTAVSPSSPQGEDRGEGQAPVPTLTPSPSPASGRREAYANPADIDCEMLVLGAGPGGYSASFRAADLGLNTVLVERYPTLGGVCLNVGCIPSKALLHAAKVVEEALSIAKHGIVFGQPTIDLDRLRRWKADVVGKLTTGLAGMAKARRVQVLQGVGKFLNPNHLAVEGADGRKVVRFQKAIIAAGSRAVKLPFLPKDPRIVDSTGALELCTIPKHLLVIGGGIIGLEMATVYSTLGARISVVETLEGLMPGTDRDLVKVWEKRNTGRFEKMMLKTRVVAVETQQAGLKVSFEGEQAPAQAQAYDMILVSAGRTPNGGRIDANKAGVAVTERGFIGVDSQMRTNVPHIFAIGDLVGQPMLAHKAVHEGHVAAEAAAGQKSHFDAKVIPAVAYTDPEIAWVGFTEEQARAQGVKYAKSQFPWAASGRAIANGRDEGFTKLLFDAATHRLIGAGIVGTNAGDLIAEAALAIEMGCDPVDIGKTIHPHPTLSESVGMAAEVFKGVCTDLPPARKR